MLIISHKYSGSLELFYGQFPSHRGVLVSVMGINAEKTVDIGLSPILRSRLRRNTILELCIKFDE
jgi:hypothetical protein